MIFFLYTQFRILIGIHDEVDEEQHYARMRDKVKCGWWIHLGGVFASNFRTTTIWMLNGILSTHFMFHCFGGHHRQLTNCDRVPGWNANEELVL